ncbi:MAG: RDD family protein [Desulfuromonadaceae bacterium]
MQLICPQCNFTRDLEGSEVPSEAVQVTCPKCNNSFRFDPAAEAASTPDTPAHTEPPFDSKNTPNETALPETHTAEIPDKEAADAYVGTAAGFWIRAVAALLDSVISSALQLAMAFVLGSITDLSGANTLPMVQMLIMLFSTLAGVFYYVFFTGYSGQTPGKMALRVKVVRLDDTQVSYGQAFIRETIGKFISGIVLGIGYLMVALRSDKRGLHDLMADTKVVRI